VNRSAQPQELLRSRASQKRKMNNTHEIQKVIFPLKSEQDYNSETQRSPYSLPHLIIENKKRVLGTLILIYEMHMKVGEVAMIPNPLGSYL
jgi:hypothetical protein